VCDLAEESFPRAPGQPHNAPPAEEKADEPREFAPGCEDDADCPLLDGQPRHPGCGDCNGPAEQPAENHGAALLEAIEETKTVATHRPLVEARAKEMRRHAEAVIAALVSERAGRERAEERAANLAVHGVEQCPKCSGWLPTKLIDGKAVPTTACRPCWEIERLQNLLAAGVKVSRGESADMLRDKLQRAEERIAELEGYLDDIANPYNRAETKKDPDQ
jgi:hypothetical protein